ncbi:MAG TPA: amidohydrolase family protein, partial [Planctomycetota bacterium]|nr:amidohydrolase family protein [Planctomycetota bacterium]
NEEWLSWLHPVKRARTLVYMSASGVELTATIVKDHLARITELARALPPGSRLHLYAMDRTYSEDGTADVERTPFFVPDESVLGAARENPDLFVPVISVHPYRKDALEALESGARAGSRHVKWLPNAMGMNPSSTLVEPFYRKMVELDMVLLTHTGGEDAFEASYPELGNPLLLRKPLEMGVKVVALHGASNGKSVDIEDPAREGISSWKLLFRLLEDPRYDGLLFADTASMTFFNHLKGALHALLDREDLQRRFVHGSDYPLCGVNMALWTWKLAWEGFITDEEAAALDEIYGYNPLLFDFVVKRTVRHPVTGKRLALSVFKTPPALAPRPAAAP